MPEKVFGPTAAAFDVPNSFQIGRLQVQIKQLTAAKDDEKEKDGRKKDIYQKQIEQLRANQNILYQQTSGAAAAQPGGANRFRRGANPVPAGEADLAAVKKTLGAELSKLEEQLKQQMDELAKRIKEKIEGPSTSLAPLQARVKELKAIIASLP